MKSLALFVYVFVFLPSIILVLLFHTPLTTLAINFGDVQSETLGALGGAFSASPAPQFAVMSASGGGGWSGIATPSMSMQFVASQFGYNITNLGTATGFDLGTGVALYGIELSPWAGWDLYFKTVIPKYMQWGLQWNWPASAPAPVYGYTPASPVGWWYNNIQNPLHDLTWMSSQMPRQGMQTIWSGTGQIPGSRYGFPTATGYPQSLLGLPSY